MTGPIQQFTFREEVQPNLRAMGLGWALRGRFSVNVRFEPSADVRRYEYRQYIMGTAWTQAGQFHNPSRPTLESWYATGPQVNAARAFQMGGGGLPTSWQEDAQGTSHFGHRSNTAVSRTGLVDRYLSSQMDGDRYELLDTYGMTGANRIPGTKLFFDLQYRFLIVDRLNNGWRRIHVHNFRTSAERLLT